MMKRQFILIGLVAFAFLLLASISATLAAPGDKPLLQGSSETEPNNDFGTANTITVPGYATGSVSNTNNISLTPDTQDYYVMSNENGRQYQASLTVLQNPGDLTMRIRLYDGSRNLIETSSSSSSDVSISWTAYTITHYVRVEALAVTTDTVLVATYQLDIDELAMTPTPTDTPIPTDTPVATPTSVSAGDNYENHDGFTDNNSKDQAYELPVEASVTLSSLAGAPNFYPVGDKDWFKVWGKNGKWYQVTTSDLSGVDTYLEIRDQNNGVVTTNDDYGEGYASQASWGATYNGYYYIYIKNKVDTTGSYDMTVTETDAPAPGPTSTPGPDPASGSDACEDNSDFEYACVIAANDTQTFNFYPPFGGVDNDFFKVWVKPGFIYECATAIQDPGIDPNMIVFTGPSWDDAIGGNDDVEVGNLDSFFSYYATYEGWLYVLVGTGDRTPSDISASNYELRCEMKTPGQTSTPEPDDTPTPAPTSDSPTDTPIPVATSTPASAGLTVHPLTTPTPVPDTTPAPHFVPVSLLVYYDGNGDQQPGAGEGIAGVSAQAYEAATNQLLAQGFTDGQGNLEFTVSAQGPVRVSVPFFGFSQLVAGEGASIYLRIPPQSLPGEAP